MATKARQAAQAKYNSKPEQVQRRTARNTARRQMISEGKAHKGDGKDVDHKDGNPLNNKASNRVLKTKAANRSYARTSGAHKKNARD
jgi:hypothetical protein